MVTILTTSEAFDGRLRAPSSLICIAALLGRSTRAPRHRVPLGILSDKLLHRLLLLPLHPVSSTLSPLGAATLLLPISATLTPLVATAMLRCLTLVRLPVGPISRTSLHHHLHERPVVALALLSFPDPSC